MGLCRAAPGILCALILALEFLAVTSQGFLPYAPTPGPAPGDPVTPPLAVSPPSPPLVAVSPPPPPPPPVSSPQVLDMMEALRDAGQFGAIAGLLEGLQMKTLTPMTTWFVPNDEAFSNMNFPKNVTRFIDYHVIRELLPFSRLSTLSVGARLPTFLGGKTVMITNNKGFNFSVDNAMVVVPDLYSDSKVAVHGINAILNEEFYNREEAIPAPKEAPAVAIGAPSFPPAPLRAPASGTTATTPSPSDLLPPSSSSVPSISPAGSETIVLPGAAHTLSSSMGTSLASILLVAICSMY